MNKNQNPTCAVHTMYRHISAPDGAQTIDGNAHVKTVAASNSDIDDLDWSVCTSKPAKTVSATVIRTVVSNTEALTSIDQIEAAINAAAKADPTNAQSKPTVDVAESVSNSESSDAEDEPRLDFSPGEIGHAERFLDYWGETTRYDSDRGFWMTWQKNHWETDINGESLLRMSRVAKNILTTELVAIRKCIEEEGDTYSRLAKRVCAEGLELHEHRTMIAALAIAKVFPEMRTNSSQYDADPMKLNCLSGVIDLPTGVLYPHRPEDMHSRIAPLELGPEGSECPRWMKFLSDIMCGDAELVSYLQRVVGYIMTGSVKESAVFVFWGGGSNGKSVFINVISHLLGSYAKTADIRTFTNIDRGNSPRNDLAELVGMRFVVSPEWELGEALDEAILKTFSGGDLVSARFLHKEHFQYRPVCKIVLASNHKPVVKGADHGIWRRLRLVPFLAQFDGSMKILELDKLLIAEEGPAILRWAMEGSQLWASQGLRTPASITEATTEYRGSQDWFLTFLDERCDIEPSAAVASQSIYNDYKTWCMNACNQSPVKQSTFNERLTGHKLQKKATKVANMWMGLKLKNGPQFMKTNQDVDSPLTQHQQSQDSNVGSIAGGDLVFGL